MGEESDGKRVCRVQNDNGEKLTEWCTFNNMSTGTAIYPHRDIHQLTWTQNGRDKEQIDHYLTNSMWRLSLVDVRGKRSWCVQPSLLCLHTLDWNSEEHGPRSTSNLDMTTADCKIPGLRASLSCSCVLSHTEEPESEEEDSVKKQWKQVRNVLDKAS